MKTTAFDGADSIRWDTVVQDTAQGTFLHSRKFLTYHGNRFKDLSLFIENDAGKIYGLFPAAEAPNEDRLVVSHPGITHGGLLHLPRCRADEVKEMLAVVLDKYAKAGYRAVLYKAVPLHVQRQIIQSDIYAVWCAGGKLVRRDLWNVIDLLQPRKTSKGHHWSVQRAKKFGLTGTILPQAEYADFHSMLTTGLWGRYGTKPPHSIDEMLDLQNRFPNAIELWGCHEPDGSLVAGVWLFKLHENCWHTQYITSNPTGRELCATDLLLEEVIHAAQVSKVRYFSFGASTDNEGSDLNAGLFSFKAGFGAGAIAHDFYRIELNS